MAADFLLRHFCGFALQLVPAALLLIVPFDRTRFRIRTRWMRLVFILVSLGLSGTYALTISAMHGRGLDAGGRGFLIGNLFMCASILVVVLLFFLLTRDRSLHKMLVLFGVVAFAAVQYSVANVFLSFTPPVPSAQRGQSYDIHTCIVYLIVTVLLLPPVALFFRRLMRPYLKAVNTDYSRREFALLTVTTVLYIAVNALLSTILAQLWESRRLSQSFYALVVLLLTALVFVVYYTVVRLSVLRAEEAERDLAAAVIHEDHERIRQDMEKQQERLHDTRQLLLTLSAIAQNGTPDELQAFIQETVEHIRITDERFCADRCLNGILQYYASLAADADIPFAVRARCSDLSVIPETDLTVLIGNALENAIRAARTHREEHPGEGDGIRFTADDSQQLLRVEIENPCHRILFAASVDNADRKKFLPAEAFLSTGGSGRGLRRIASIAVKYDGVAVFRYEEESRRFTTRITLMLPEPVT